jgi:hypothetical protein
MRLSVKAMTIAPGLLWVGAILVAGILHRLDPSYEVSFLEVTSSVYPGFHSAGTAGSLAICTVEGLIDGGISGLVLSLLYNAFARVRAEA